MSESINLQKQVYDKRQYTKVIDTSFKELGVQNFVGLDDALRRTAQWSTESMRT
jgi:hypothetical protein